MTFSSTTALALALAAGLVGAAAAQQTTTASPGTASSPPQASSPSGTAGWQAGQSQPSYGATGYQQAQPSTQQTPGAYGMSGQTYGQTQPGGATRPGAAASSPSALGQIQTPTTMQIQQAQQRLHASGLYHGPIDGRMDPDTRAALARFQQQQGLQRTEQLDQQTWARLMGGQTGMSGSSTAGTQSPLPAGTGGTSQPAR